MTSRGTDPFTVATLSRQSLATRAADTLKRYIVLERLEPGFRLPPERRMAEVLNVSRTVLREALSQLIGEGLIVRTAPHALCVAAFDRVRVASELAPIDEQEVTERALIELRAIIEIGAIEVIARRATDEQLREIERWVIQIEKRVATGQPLEDVDAGFHIALLRAAGNSAIDQFLPLINETMYFNTRHFPGRIGVRANLEDDRTATEHRRIFEALKRRDSEAARVVLAAHLSPYLRRDPAPEHERLGDRPAVTAQT